jgi:hypothetical protein
MFALKKRVQHNFKTNDPSAGVGGRSILNGSKIERWQSKDYLEWCVC